MAGQQVIVSVLADNKNFVRGMGDLSKKADSTFSKLGKIAGVGLLAAGAAVGAWVVDTGKALANIERIGNQTNAVIESTGGAAGRTRDDIDALAGSIERMTAVEAETITEGQNLLLTFTNIKGANFDRATVAFTDLAVAMNKGSLEGLDMASSSQLVGKALNDPIKGLGALREVGVQFTAQQEEQIKAMVKAGDVAGAQAIILGELETQFGGSAEAAGNTAVGKFKKFENIVGEVSEKVLGFLMPAFHALGDWLLEEGVPRLEEFGTWLEANVVPALRKLGDWLRTEVVPRLAEMGRWLKDNSDFLSAVAAAVGGLLAVLGVWSAVTKIATAVQLAFNVVLAANPIAIVVLAIAALVAGLVYFFTQTETGKKAWAAFTKALTDLWQKFSRFISDTWKAITGFFTDAAKRVKDTWTGVSNWFGELPGKIKGFFSGAVDWLVKSGSRILEGLLNGVEAIFGKDVAKWFRNLKNALLAFLKDPAGWLVRIGEHIINGLLGGVKAIFGGGVTDFFKGVENKVKGFMKDPGGWLKSTGRRVIEGLWAGINDKVSWIKNKISGFVGSVERWFKDFFGINSPSKRMRDRIGRWLPEGIAEAFDRDTSVARAMARFSTGMEASFDPHLAMAEPQAAQAGGNTYRIEVQAVAPNAEVGRAVVKAISDFERSGGRQR